ncbi:MAG: cytochrome c biogenesis protein ResB [Chloroflexota bacterium]
MASPAVVSTANTRPSGRPIPARLGYGLWHLFTSVDFAVFQIIFLLLLAVIGMTIKQLPDFAYRSATDYAAAIDATHARYDPVIGTTIVDVMARLSLFSVFRSPWFSAGLVVLVVSIVVCTLDRTPKLWRGVSDIRVAQPAPYFDPRLPDRAAMDGVPAESVRTVLRRNGFHVREATEADGARFFYGDRHQYTKMATLLTHAGLITFLVAAAATSRLGDEQGLVVAEGESLTVQPIGTPGLLLVKNNAFDAPGFDTGRPTDFTTDLAVFQDGREIARKTIRVNDPLSVAGYTFHQNGFGPAPHLVLKSAGGALLWDAPVPMTDAASGLPYTSIGVPGRDMGLKLLLDKSADGTGVLLVIPYKVVGTGADGKPIEDLYPAVDLHRGDAKVSKGLDLSIGLTDFGEFTLLIAKRDPGQGLVWVAFGLLIAGITISFYRPRRRVWTRLEPDGRLGIVWRSDRYVDVEREFGRLLDQLVAARRPAVETAP